MNFREVDKKIMLRGKGQMTSIRGGSREGDVTRR